MNQQTAPEPSMEEILASIRRIISEDKKPLKRPPSPMGKVATGDDTDILDLHNPVDSGAPRNGGGYAPGSNGYTSQARPPSKGASGPSSFLSETTVSASRDAFKTLDRNTSGALSQKSLEEVVEHALRPFLKDWLDAHLPGIVKQIVQEQVEHITRSKLQR